MTVVTSSALGGEGLGDFERRIADGGARLIADRGFGNTKVQDIARALGISLRTLYETVRTKEDVLVLIIEYWAESWRAALERAALETASDSASEPLSRLRQAMRSLIALQDEHSHLSVIVYREQTRLDAAGRRILTEREQERVRRLASILRQAAEEGSIRPEIDPDLAAASMLFLVDALPLRAAVTVEISGTESWPETMVDMVINGYGPSPAELG